MHKTSCTAGHQGPENFYKDIGALANAKQVKDLINQLIEGLNQ